MNTKIKNLIFSLLTTVAFFINIVITEKGNFQADAFDFDKNALFSLIAFIFFYIFYKKNSKNSKSLIIHSFALFFSMCMLLGESYNAYGNWNLLFGSIPVLLIALVRLCGYFIFFDRLLEFIYQKILTVSLNKGGKEEKTVFWKRLILILLCWLPIIIAFYPAILSPDPSNQIKQFFGIPTKYIESIHLIDNNVLITNHHPVLHTVILGGLAKLGSNLGSVNFGLFLYSIIQTFALAFTLNYVIQFMLQLGIDKKYLKLTTLFFALVPVFPLYAMSPVKDVYFTILLIWYMMFLYKYIRNEIRLNLKWALYVSVLILFIMLVRNNGLHVIVLSFPFLLFTNRRDWKKILIVFLVSILAYKSYTNILLPQWGISPGSIREALSIPFQQTARYVKEHAEELNDTDKAAIDKVLNITTIAQRYNPELADPVKNEFNKDANDDDLKNYLDAWKNGLIKHPDTYIQATFNNIYGYFYPGKTRWYIYYKYDTRLKEDGIDYHYNDLKIIRNIVSGYGVIYQHIPVVGLTVNIGFQTFLVLGCAMVLLRNKSYQYLIFLLPMLVSILVCIASPANSYFRYAMPYIFASPLIIAMTIRVVSKTKKV